MSKDNNSDKSKTQTYSNDETKINNTQTYSNSDNSQKTQKYSMDIQNINKTVTYDEREAQIKKTEIYDKKNSQRIEKTKTHNLGINDDIELNGIKYTIIEIISEETGEAVIYKINNQNKDILVLKLYNLLINKEEPKTEALETIKNIKDPDILRLYDYGTGANKFQDNFCFEICDFAKGGDLLSVNNIEKKYTPEFLKSNVIPEIFKGIKRLHKNRIYHCDLKPENVFYLDEEQTDLIIGDYGSAKTFEKNLRRTTTVKGTNFYLPPEQARGIISEKNDYYSFGMILLHLLYSPLVEGDRMYDTLDKIITRSASGQKIISYDPMYDQINRLIEGLTLYSSNSRWGEKEVERWIKGEDVEVLYPARRDIIPIKLGRVTIKTEENLIDFVENDDNWYDDLIEDSEGFKMLLQWLSNIQDLVRKKIFSNMVNYHKVNDDKEYVKEAILRYFNSERPITIDMKTYSFFGEENLNDLVDFFFKQIDDIWKFTNIEKIRFYIFQLEFCLRQLKEISEQKLKVQISALIDKISAILNIDPKEDFSDYQAVLYPQIDDLKLLDIFYVFNDKRVLKDDENNSYNTIEEVGLLFAKNDDLFNDKFAIIEKRKFFIKNNREVLNDLNYIDTLIGIFPDKVMSNIEFLDLNNIQDDKCKIKYKFQKSLTEFFNSKGINKEFLKLSQEVNEFEFKNDSHCGWSKFLIYLEIEHNIQDKDLSTNNKKEFRSKLLIKDEKNKLDIKITETKEKFRLKKKYLNEGIWPIKSFKNSDFFDNIIWNYVWGFIAFISAYFLVGGKL